MTDQTAEPGSTQPDTTETDRNPEQQEIADVQDQLDEQADGDGLAAEAGSGEETGLSEG